MFQILAATVPPDVALILIAAVFIGAIASVFTFMYSQVKANRMLREDMKKDIEAAQIKAFSNAAEILAGKLTEYTDKVLAEKVNQYYSDLVARELFPSVNDATKKLTELSQELINRQEQGMNAVADAVVKAMSESTQDYIDKEAEVLLALKDNTAVFAAQLQNVTQSVKHISEQNNDVFERTKAVSKDISIASESITEAIVSLKTVFTQINETITIANKDILDNRNIYKDMIDTSSQIQKLAGESSQLLAQQNERMSVMLSNAVSAMQNNTEQAAKSLLGDFNSRILDTSGKIEQTVTALQAITESIQHTAVQFGEGLKGSYDRLSGSIDQKLDNAAQTMAKAVDGEYSKIITSAENYSNAFSVNISKFNKSLEDKMESLQLISEQLNNNISSFKNEARDSCRVFEVGIEKSVSAALTALDESLADIVGRLVSVTVNIQEAADALPRAVKAI